MTPAETTIWREGMELGLLLGGAAMTLLTMFAANVICKLAWRKAEIDRNEWDQWQ